MKNLFPCVISCIVCMLSNIHAEDVFSVIRKSPYPYYQERLSALSSDTDADPQLAVARYSGLRNTFALGPKNKALRNALVAELLKNPRVPEYIESRLDEIPQSHIQGGGRKYFFNVLGDIRTEWSVGLLGKFLMDETLLSDPGFTEEEIREIVMKNGGGGSPNHSYAAWALARMTLNDAPTGPPIGSGHQKGAVEKWRPWWEENKHDIAATLVAEGEEESVDAHPKTENRSQGAELLTPRKTLTPPEESKEANEGSSSANTIFVWLAAMLIFVATIYYGYKKRKVS